MSGAEIIAVSADKREKQRAWQDDIGAPFSFIPDPQAVIIGMYRVKMPLIRFAKRTTFVINKDGIIKHIDRGKSAINIDGAAQACSILKG